MIYTVNYGAYHFTSPNDRMAEILIRRSELSHKRLNVVQTEFGQNVSFEMRTLRFIIAVSSATEAQDQTIDCNLHLEPVDDVSSTQPDDCSCHTEADCLNQGFSLFSLEHDQYNLNSFVNRVGYKK